MSTATKIWAVQEADGHWYPCDHMSLDRHVTANPKNARPFFGDSGRHYANLFAAIGQGRRVVPHPHPEQWKHSA